MRRTGVVCGRIPILSLGLLVGCGAEPDLSAADLGSGPHGYLRNEAEQLRVIEAMLGSGGLDTPHRWNHDQPVGTPALVTYSFMQELPSHWEPTLHATRLPFRPLPEVLRELARDLLELVSRHAEISFVEVESGGEIDIGATSGGGGQAVNPYRFGNEEEFPMASGEWAVLEKRNGDFFIGIGENDEYEQDDRDIIDHTPFVRFRGTFIHELMHALGVSHTRELELTADGQPRYWSLSDVLLTDDQDMRTLSLMSMHDDPEILSRGIRVWGVTPLVYDVLVLQYLYGATTQSNHSDTTYTFPQYNVQNQTIWDTSGSDTIDVSDHEHPATIDLNQGALSSIGYNKVIRYWADQEMRGHRNVSIALGTQIENALGGSAEDVFFGNELDNGIDGGPGTDTVIYSRELAEYDLEILADQVIVSDQGTADGVDTLYHIERIQFSDQTVRIDDGKGCAASPPRTLGPLASAGVLVVAVGARRRRRPDAPASCSETCGQDHNMEAERRDQRHSPLRAVS